MPVDKTGLFKPKDVHVARIAKALSHPARVSILRELARRNACICGELVEVIPLAQATVSQHLKELKMAGLIKGEIDGPRSCYCIDTDRLRDLQHMLKELFDEITCCPSNDKH